jgi:hypothetical protein
MLKSLFTLILAFLVSGLFAQEKDETPVIDITKTVIDTTPLLKKPELSKRVNFDLSAGTSFMYSKDFGSGTSTYIAPSLKYKFTPRLNLNVGVMFVNSNIAYNRFLPFYQEPSVVFRTKPVNKVLAYASANYMLSERLTVSGSVVRDLNSSQGYGVNSTPSVQSMSLHMDYKLTKNISVGAGMHMSQGGYFGSPGNSFGFNPSYNYNPLFNY